ncbi:MAG: DcaP family trimeric outer membrane transporter [Elusimicrobiales bacterium]
MKKTLLSLLLLLPSGPARAEFASKFNTEFYGFIKNDLIYSDHGTSTNEYRIYAVSGRKDRAFRASARASRFGLNLSSGAALSGKLEADFLGLTDSLAGAAGTVSDVRLRHAYAVVKAGRAEILAGQTFYPVTADLPETINDYYLGNSGALWSRAPQLRITYATERKLKLTTALVRPTSKLTDAEGTHAALPGLQAKAEQQLGGARVSLAGACGLWKSTSTQEKADISLLVAAFNLPLGRLTLTGEAWTGRNLADFLGGLGNTGYGARAVAAVGGYLGVKYKPGDDLWFNFIYGVDDPDNARVAARGKTRNATALVNAVARFHGFLETGLEVSSLNTGYRGLPDRSAMNYQLSVKLLF